MRDTWNLINKLNKKELLDLVKEYNSYVIEIVDREDGSIPVCIQEYYELDYQLK